MPATCTLCVFLRRFSARTAARAALPFLALSALAALGPSAAAQSPLYTAPHVDVGLQPRLVAAGDVNGDGLTDLVVARAAFQVSVVLGIGGGAFAAPATFLAEDKLRAIALADLDEDGDLDLALASWQLDGPSDPVLVRLGSGDGTFGAPSTFLTAGEPSALVPADLDRDGHLDLVVPCVGSNRLSVLYGHGDGSFDPHVDFAAGSFGGSAAVGDLNGDTWPDVLVGNANLLSVHVLLNDGAGALLAPTPIAIGFWVSAVALGDVNADGRLDGIVGSNATNHGALLPGLGNGSFAPKVDLPSTFAAPMGIVAADFDEDGDDDVAVTMSNVDGVAVIESHGDLSFDPVAVRYGTLRHPQTLIAADVNDDGDLDLVTVPVTEPAGTLVGLLLGRGDGSFAPDFELGNAPISAASGDLDGDARPDLVVGGTSNVSVLANRGLGGFEPGATFFAGIYNRSAALADLDEDDVLDLVLTNDSGLRLFLGDGDGGFTDTLSPASASTPHWAAVADVDGDEHLDLVAACTATDLVQVHLGFGDGTFAPALGTPVGDEPERLLLDDVDGDGTLDLVVAFGIAGTSSGWLQVLPGAGDGSFGAPTVILLNTFRFGLASGDLDGDGAPELATLDLSGNALLVLANDGRGAFAVPVAYALPGIPGQDVVIADLDGDGASDVACTVPDGAELTGKVAVFRGLGDGTLAAPETAGTGWGASTLLADDLDGDGALDLAVGCGSNQLDVLLNRNGPWNDLGHPLAGAQGLPKQTGEGSLVAGTPFTIALRDAAPFAAAAHFIGIGTLNAPFKGGTMVPTINLINTPLLTNAAGDIELTGPWPLHGPSGFTLYFQFWLHDPAGILGWSSSGAISATLP